MTKQGITINVFVLIIQFNPNNLQKNNYIIIIIVTTLTILSQNYFSHSKTNEISFLLTKNKHHIFSLFTITIGVPDSRRSLEAPPFPYPNNKHVLRTFPCPNKLSDGTTRGELVTRTTREELWRGIHSSTYCSLSRRSLEAPPIPIPEQQTCTTYIPLPE